MPLKFHPEPGVIVVCDYDTGFRVSEMVKRRPAVIITPRFRRREGLCAVVPLSTTEPEPAEPYHHPLILKSPLPRPWNSPVMWVKADMLATVGFRRLSPIRAGRVEGRRRYIYPQVSPEDWAAIRDCVSHALALKGAGLKAYMRRRTRSVKASDMKPSCATGRRASGTITSR